MPIVFPDLRGAKCKFFMACGQIETTDPAIVKRIKKQPDWMVARRRTSTGTVYIRAGFGGKTGKHCHVDISTTDYYGSKGGPKTTNKLSDIIAILEDIKGLKISLDLKAPSA